VIATHQCHAVLSYSGKEIDDFFVGKFGVSFKDGEVSVSE
jgi:hypothetical protein